MLCQRYLLLESKRHLSFFFFYCNSDFLKFWALLQVYNASIPTSHTRQCQQSYLRTCFFPFRGGSWSSSVSDESSNSVIMSSSLWMWPLLPFFIVASHYNPPKKQIWTLTTPELFLVFLKQEVVVGFRAIRLYQIISFAQILSQIKLPQLVPNNKFNFLVTISLKSWTTTLKSIAFLTPISW